MKNILVLSLVLSISAPTVLAQSPLFDTKTVPSVPHVPYTGIVGNDIYYEDLLVLDIEEIYSSHYKRNIYRVISYSGIDESTEQVTVTPETYSYNWVYRLYTDYFYNNSTDIMLDMPGNSHFNTLPYYHSTPSHTHVFTQPAHRIILPQRQRKVFKKISKKTTRPMGRQMHPSRRDKHKKYVVKHKRPSKKMRRAPRRAKKTFRRIP